ncbi:MAG TPA: GNAT family N-acetyltransferase [Herpetosiphonaceae bacterium]
MELASRLRAYFQAVDPDTTIDVLPVVPGDPASVPAAADGVVVTPLLVCTAQTFRPAPAVPGLEFVALSSESSLAEVTEGLDANALGFDPAAPATPPDEAEAFRAQLITNRAFTARLDTQPAGAGMFTPPIDGIAELVGITTLAAYRRRGIAAALTGEIVRLAFAHNVDIPFLRTDNLEAYRVYQRLGFAHLATLLSRPDA